MTDVVSTIDACAIDTGLHDGPVAVAVMDWPADCGAEAVFLGRTRVETHSQHGGLMRLEYEVYAPMANKLLHEMAAAASAKFGCKAIRLVHAHGVLPPGEASIVIQVATPHRAAAFDACRYLIERVKHELPVWKREIWEHGETFVEGCCVHTDAHNETPTRGA